MNRNEFTTKYTLIKNPFSEFRNKDDIYFAPDDIELDYVRSHDPACVWTITIGDDGALWLYSGYHYEERISFLLTQQPVPQDIQYEVKWEEPKRKT